MEHIFNETFITAAACVIFIPLVFKPAKKALLNMLDQRAEHIIKSLKESDQIYREAESVLREAQKQYKEAQKTIKLILSQAEEEAFSMLENAKHRAESMARKKTELSISRINEQEKQIIEDVKQNAIQLAVNKVEESLINELGRDAQFNLIQEGIKAIKKLSH